MPDQDLPATGEQVSLELLLDGLPQKIVDSVVSFSEEPKFQKVETRVLGSTGVQYKYIPDGWGGQLEVARKNGQLDDLIDAFNLAVRNNVPVLLTLTRRVSFADGTSRTHVYPDCKFDFSTSGQRGQNVTTRLSWVCGVDRI